MDIRSEFRRSKTALTWIAVILGIHFSLLLLMLPDYWPDNDLGYHISLARQYAIHGTYFWDSLNWAPTGRPNLQGPLLHFANGVPRELDWSEARTLAQVLERAALNDRIVNSYYDSLSAAMAVYTDLRQEYGHWGEVRPRKNPAARIPTADKVYVLPLPPGDAKLAELAAAGLVRLHGGSEWTSIVTLGPPRPPEEIAPLTADILHEEGAWLAEKAHNNRMPPVVDVFSPRAIAELRRQRASQKCHPGRIQLAYLLYAASMDGADPELALAVRGGARAWGAIASFIGDETALDYLSDARFELFRRNAARFSEASLALRNRTRPTPELDGISGRLFDVFFEQN